MLGYERSMGSYLKIHYVTVVILGTAVTNGRGLFNITEAFRDPIQFVMGPGLLSILMQLRSSLGNITR